MNKKYENFQNEIFVVMSQKVEQDISVYDESFCKKIIEKRIQITESNTYADYVEFINKSDFEAEALLGALRINYSEFFRNWLTYSLLEQLILPELSEQKRGVSEIRIWSAGCAMGQEPYSAAILADRLSKTSGKPIRYRIIATDTCATALDFAKKGKYSPEDMKNIRFDDLNQYFNKSEGLYQICDSIKERVSFFEYELLDKQSITPPESIYGNFDVVFCSNLLFYYNPSIREFILQKLLKSLSNKGYLITGEAEQGIVSKLQGMRKVASPACIFQKI